MRATTERVARLAYQRRPLAYSSETNSLSIYQQLQYTV